MLSHTKAPKISIVMAAYNEENSIERAIESILSQSFSDWELIVVDDGSVDSTVDIIVKYSVSDDRIKLILNDSNIGLPLSLNKGISLARAEIIARADADDINISNRFYKQYEFLSHNQSVDVVGSGAVLVDEFGIRRQIVSLPRTHKELCAIPLYKTHFFHPSVMLRKSFFEKIGVYDYRFVRAEDKELWIRGLAAGCIYANLDEPLIEYSTNGYNRSWGSIHSMIKSMLMVTKKYGIRWGYIEVLALFVYSSLVKLKLYKPSSLK